MPDEKRYDEFRKLEPISRLLRALGVPPPEALIPTPRELARDLGVPLLEDELPKIKEKIHTGIVKTIKR